jgi:hypothetical protein
MACDALAKLGEAKRVGVAKRASAYLAFDCFAREAGVPGWPTSMWMMSSPAAWRAFACLMTSITTKGSIALRKDGACAFLDVSGARFVMRYPRRPQRCF